MRTLAILLIWFLLAAVSALTAWQIHVTLLAVAAVLIERGFAPADWSLLKLPGLSRFSILVIGCGWLFYVFRLEHFIFEASAEGGLLKWLGKTGLILAAVLLGIYGIQWWL